MIFWFGGGIAVYFLGTLFVFLGDDALACMHTQVHTYPLDRSFGTSLPPAPSFTACCIMSRLAGRHSHFSFVCGFVWKVREG